MQNEAKRHWLLWAMEKKKKKLVWLLWFRNVWNTLRLTQDPLAIYQSLYQSLVFINMHGSYRGFFNRLRHGSVHHLPLDLLGRHGSTFSLSREESQRCNRHPSMERSPEGPDLTPHGNESAWPRARWSGSFSISKS